MKVLTLITLVFASTLALAQKEVITLQDTLYVGENNKAVQVKLSRMEIEVGDVYEIRGISFRIDRDMSQGYWLQINGRDYYRKRLEDFERIISACTRNVLIARN